MIEALTLIFAGYAGYANWPWWAVTVVGALSGFQVANARMYRSGWKEHIESGQPVPTEKIMQTTLVGMLAGAAITTAIYFLAHYVFH